MTGLETAIREAIDRADARDAAAREHVYRSARQALERSLARRPDLDRATIDEQRQRFDELIGEIESEKVAQEKAASRSGRRTRLRRRAGRSPSARRSPSRPPATAIGRRLAAPGRRPPRRQGSSRHAPADRREEDLPVSPAPSEAGGRPRPAAETGARPTCSTASPREVRAERHPTKKEREKADRKERRLSRRERRQRRPRTAARMMSALFLLVSLLVFGALPLWFLSATGLVGDTGTAGGGAGSFRKFDAVSGSQTPDLLTENGFVGAWSPIFVAGKGETVSPGPAAEVEKVTDERGKALRLTSTTAGPDGDLRIEVPAALMDRMAGRTSIVALNVRAVGGRPTQIAVECAFPSLGGCRRRPLRRGWRNDRRRHEAGIRRTQHRRTRRAISC